jgi:hypothetical protein
MWDYHFYQVLEISIKYYTLYNKKIYTIYNKNITNNAE